MAGGNGQRGIKGDLLVILCFLPAAIEQIRLQSMEQAGVKVFIVLEWICKAFTVLQVVNTIKEHDLKVLPLFSQGVEQGMNLREKRGWFQTVLQTCQIFPDQLPLPGKVRPVVHAGREEVEVDLAMIGDGVQTIQQQGRHAVQAKDRETGRQDGGKILCSLQPLQKLLQHLSPVRGVVKGCAQLRPEGHLPFFGGIGGAQPLMLPAIEHLRPHDLILIKDIGQLLGQLIALQPALLPAQIAQNRRKERC